MNFTIYLASTNEWPSTEAKLTFVVIGCENYKVYGYVRGSARGAGRQVNT
jgi:hypothetical protein